MTFAYAQDLAAFALTGGSKDSELESLASDVGLIFGNKFARGWYQQNTCWMTPEMVEVIDKQLESNPLGTDLEYFNQMN